MQWAFTVGRWWRESKANQRQNKEQASDDDYWLIYIEYEFNEQQRQNSKRWEKISRILLKARRKTNDESSEGKRKWKINKGDYKGS